MRLSRLLSILVLAASSFPALHAAPVAEAEARWRLDLVRTAARKASLADVGLDYHDLYGVIHAESGWVARDGMGKNGVVSVGVAQFEPATARAVGLRNPKDPVQSVEAAAVLLREAAQWSARRLDALALGPTEWAVRLREGISIYYNLSSRGRSAWNGLNTYRMPVETQQHIRNSRQGALLASRLESGQPQTLAVAALVPRVSPPATPRRPPAAVRPATTVAVAAVTYLRRTATSIELPQGKIEWSRPPQDAGRSG
jgi:hypothetical protein